MANQNDLFGYSPAQGSLFGEGRMQEPEQSTIPNPEDIRRRLNTLIAKVRAAEEMPWSQKDARMWQTVFPNMAKWLPEEEAEQLRFEFSREMERLSDAA